MYNLTIEWPNVPGSLARFGQALGAAGISVEGGGVFGHGAVAIANFLVADGAAARSALAAAGLRVTAVREVVALRLKQDQPGQLGAIAQRMAQAGVNIEVQYSDHDHRLVLVVDRLDAARTVAQDWAAEPS